MIYARGQSGKPFMSAAPIQLHIETLRSLCASEREKIAELKAKLGEGLRSELDNASAKLDDVESIFLDPKTLALARDDAAWTLWLNNANAVFGIAVMTRDHVERLAEKLSSDERVIE
jgi:hypothetical protein